MTAGTPGCDGPNRDLANLTRIKVPVLTGASSVTVAAVPCSGHAITLSRNHRMLDNAVLVFLRTRVRARLT